MKVSELPIEIKLLAFKYFAKGTDDLSEAFDWRNTKEGFSFWDFWHKYKEAKLEDTIVESVINQFKERSNVGIEKYGVTLDRTDLTRLEWMVHFREELMDGLLYLERVIQDTKKL